MLLLLMLVAQLDAGVTCPGVTATDLEAWRVEVMDIVDWQRAAYAEHVLAEHHVTCPAFVSAVTPTRIVALDGAVQVSWEPVDGPLCFEAVTVTAGGVTSTVKVDGSPCVSFDDRGAPHITLEDFDFDGRPDVRIWTTLSMAQSRRLDVVLLQRAQQRFEYSPELSRLDDAQPDAKTKTIESREVIGNAPSKRVRWVWRKGVLVRVKK